jgi:hypothetical protein
MSTSPMLSQQLCNPVHADAGEELREPGEQRGTQAELVPTAGWVSGANSSAQMTPERGGGGGSSSADGVEVATDAAGRGTELKPAGRISMDRPDETPSSSEAGTAAVAALERGERRTISRPRTAGADLREARTAAASTAAEAGTNGGPVAGMER